jgi:hypothetical protein
MTKIDDSIKTIQDEVESLKTRGDKLSNVLSHYIAKCDCGVIGCDLCHLALKVSKEWKDEERNEPTNLYALLLSRQRP